MKEDDVANVSEAQAPSVQKAPLFLSLQPHTNTLLHAAVPPDSYTSKDWIPGTHVLIILPGT